MFKKIILLMAIVASFTTAAGDCSKHLNKAENALGKAQALSEYSDQLSIELMDLQRRNSSLIGGMFVSNQEMRFLEYMIVDADKSVELYEAVYKGQLSIFSSCELLESDNALTSEEAEAQVDPDHVELAKLKELLELM